MKKTAIILFSALTFYCNGQEKIILTTGDSLMGTVSKIDDDHSRITKVDGTSVMILSSLIKKRDDLSSMKFEEAFSHEVHQLIIGTHTAPAGAMRYYIIIDNNKLEFNEQPALGLLAGLDLKYNFQPKIAFAAEINYEQKGGMHVTSDYRSIDRTGYLTLPLSFNFRLDKEERRIAFYLKAGLYFGYLINETSVYKPKIGEVQKYYSIDLSNQNRFDWGLITGFGWQIPVKEHFQFSIEVRNNLGLNNLANTSSPFNYYKIKNESFAIIFGLAYKINEKTK